MTPVAIALGSNLGDREGHLRDAIDALRPFVDRLTVSQFYTTAPVDMAPVDLAGLHPDFLNAAAIGDTALSARQLLDRLLAIEATLGRERPFPGASRTVDLDLILYGDALIDEPPSLVVPHPRFRERAFVLDPLAEVAADWTDPVTGLTISQLRENLADVERRRTDPHRMP